MSPFFLLQTVANPRFLEKFEKSRNFVISVVDFVVDIVLVVETDLRKVQTANQTL